MTEFFPKAQPKGWAFLLPIFKKGVCTHGGQKNSFCAVGAADSGLRL